MFLNMNRLKLDMIFVTLFWLYTWLYNLWRKLTWFWYMFLGGRCAPILDSPFIWDFGRWECCCCCWIWGCCLTCTGCWYWWGGVWECGRLWLETWWDCMFSWGECVLGVCICCCCWPWDAKKQKWSLLDCLYVGLSSDFNYFVLVTSSYIWGI